MTIIATVVKSTDDNLERLVSSSTMTHVECGGKITAEWEDHKELGKRLVLTCQKCRIKDKLSVNLNGEVYQDENISLSNLLSGKQTSISLTHGDGWGHRLTIWRIGGEEEEKKKNEKEREDRKKLAEIEKRKSAGNWLIGIAIFIAFIIILWLLLR